MTNTMRDFSDAHSRPRATRRTRRAGASTPTRLQHARRAIMPGPSLLSTRGDDISPRIVFVDLDDTISDARWRIDLWRHKRFDEYHGLLAKDKPVPEMVEMLTSLSADGWYIIGLTARPVQWMKL